MKYIYLKGLDKPLKIYTNEEAKEQAERWRRYTRDFYIRFLKNPIGFLKRVLDKIMSWSIFNEGLNQLIVMLMWIATTALLIHFHCKFY